jgi:hypothetical protein
VRSGSKKTSSVTPEKDQQASAGSRAVPGDSRPSDDTDPSANGRQQAGAPPPPAPHRPSRRELKNWRVRSRLILLVVIPTVTAVILGGTRIVSFVQSALAYQRVEQLAGLSGKITGLTQALQNEREDTIRYIVLGTNGGRADALSAKPSVAAQAALEIQALNQDYRVTSGWASQVTPLLHGIGSSYPSLTQQEAQGAVTAINSLGDLRASAIRTQLPPQVVIQEYANTINGLLALDDQVAVGSNDSELVGAVRVASLVSNMKEEASQQQAILTSALAPDLVGLGVFGPAQLSAITDALAEQQGNLAEFNTAATASQRQLYDNAVSGATVARAQAQEQQAISLASSGTVVSTDPTIADASASASYTVSSLHSVEQQLVASTIARSRSLRDNAITWVIIDSLAVLLVLAIALVMTIIVGSSMVRPLRRLRAGALEVAGRRLPEAVRRIGEAEDPAIVLEVEPIDVDSADEIGEVARAFDQVHNEALQLAANEAALRGNVNAMFVNLSRRSQSLVERQIRLIDDLEQGEQDAERLGNLFQMDHLATRMRRNSENLLVLAGHDLSRRWSQPVALVDVLRAAVSEIEQYERVSLNVQPGIAVRGQAVNDVVHLLAELAENATSLSSADTPVNIAGHLLNSGGVLIDITDQGVGMGAEEMAHANWRLDNPPVVDVAVSRRMGLFVVGRLAARHGIRVRLRPAASGGLTALVWLPDEVITNESPATSPGLSGMDTADSGADLFATELAGLGQGDWLDPDRATTEQEVTAARTPKFAPLRAEGEDAPPIPRRVPGAALRPDSAWSATGALPAFQPGRPSPAESDELSAAGQPPPAVIGREAADPGPRPRLLGEQPGPDDDASVPAFGETAFGESAWSEPAWSEPAWSEPAFGESAFSDSATSGPAFGEPMAGESAFGEPMAGESAFGEPMAGESAFGDSATSGSAFGEPMAGESAFGEPMAGEPAFSEPAVSEPAAGTDAQSAAPDDALFGVGPRSGNGASGNGASETAGLAGAPLGAPASYRWEAGTANGEVIVPPAESLADEHRLPIFEAVESDWFRHGRNAFSSPAGAEEPESTWASPADEGWRAAEIVPAPSSAGLTSAGLPKRVPKANLVPGAAASSAAPAPSRSAAATRERFASFQRGVREGRAAASGSANPAGEDETS